MTDWAARWIFDPAFAGHQPVNLLHKEAAEHPEYEHPPELRNRHMLVRKTFALGELPAEAALRVTADDYYNLYVNGEYVGQGPAQCYSFNYYFNEWDVRRHLRAGENVIDVDVYYQGLVNRAYNSGDLRQGMIAELRTEAGVLLGTDGSWRYRIAPQYGPAQTVGYDTQFLENIDQRKLAEDEAWSPVAVREDLGHTLVPQPTPPLQVYSLAPENVVALGDGQYLIDFGQELTGQFVLSARGESGDTVRLRFGEELNEDGGVRFELRCNCTYEEFWTLSGTDDVLEQYEYKAFRYVEVQAPPGVVQPSSFTATVRHYPMDPERCEFESADDRLNRIWALCRRGVQLCAQENFVDCPSREKGQYLGDNTVIGHSHLYLSGDPRLLRKAITEFALTRTVCPGLLAVAPGHLMQEIADFSLQWPLQLLTYYRYTGDADFLREMVEVADGILEHFETSARPDGLLTDVVDRWNLVDWPEGMRDGYDFSLGRPVGPGCHNVVNAFYYGCVQAVQQIKDILGISYEDELPRLRDAFLRTFLRPGDVFADAQFSDHSSLHANILPLYFGLAPDRAVPRIVEQVRERRLTCGTYMAYFVLNALTAHGEAALAYELIGGGDVNSWSTMLAEGATACCEVWSKDQKWNTSLCHGWASAPIPVLIEGIVGLRPEVAGWKEIRFAPQLPPAMAPFRLTVPTPAGQVEVRYDGERAELVAPPGVVVHRD